MLVGVFLLITLYLSWSGLREYYYEGYYEEPNPDYSVWHALVDSVAFFFQEHDFFSDTEVPAKLQMARILASIFAGAALFLIILGLLRFKFTIWEMMAMRRHVVVFGSDYKARFACEHEYNLYHESTTCRWLRPAPVLAVDPNHSVSFRTFCQGHDILYQEYSEDVVRDAALLHADRIYLLHDNDHENLLFSDRHLQDHTNPERDVFLHLGEPSTYNLITEHKDFNPCTRTNCNHRLLTFNINRNAVLDLFGKYLVRHRWAPLERKGSRRLQAILVGYGYTHQCLLENLLMMAAYKSDMCDDGWLPKIVIIDTKFSSSGSIFQRSSSPTYADYGMAESQDSALSKELDLPWKYLSDVAEIEIINQDVQHGKTLDKIYNLLEDEGCKSSLFIATGDDRSCLTIGLRLHRLLGKLSGKVPVFVRIREVRGLKLHLESEDWRYHNLLPYGGVDDVCKRSDILQDDLLRAAMIIHWTYEQIAPHVNTNLEIPVSPAEFRERLGPDDWQAPNGQENPITSAEFDEKLGHILTETWKNLVRKDEEAENKEQKGRSQYERSIGSEDQLSNQMAALHARTKCLVLGLDLTYIRNHDKKMCSRDNDKKKLKEWIQTYNQNIHAQLRRGSSGTNPDYSFFDKDNDNDLNYGARLEHERWNREKRLEGYTCVEGEKDKDHFIHNCLCEFDNIGASADDGGIQAFKIKAYDALQLAAVASLLVCTEVLDDWWEESDTDSRWWRESDKNDSTT